MELKRHVGILHIQIVRIWMVIGQFQWNDPFFPLISFWKTDLRFQLPVGLKMFHLFQLKLFIVRGQPFTIRAFPVILPRQKNRLVIQIILPMPQIELIFSIVNIREGVGLLTSVERVDGSIAVGVLEYHRESHSSLLQSGHPFLIAKLPIEVTELQVRHGEGQAQDQNEQ